MFPPPDFESGASTNSATGARRARIIPAGRSGSTRKIAPDGGHGADGCERMAGGFGSAGGFMDANRASGLCATGGQSVMRQYQGGSMRILHLLSVAGAGVVATAFAAGSAHA